MLMSALVLLGLLTAGHSPTAKAAGEQVRIGIITPFVVLESEANEYAAEARFSVSGGVESEISFELLDVWFNPAGQRTTLPLGSTPTSAAGRLTASLGSSTYTPNVEVQTVAVRLSISSESLLKAPVSSAIRLTVRPTAGAENQGAVSIISSAVAFAFATHDDFVEGDGEFKAEIKNSNFMISDLADRDNPSRRARMFVEDQLVLASFETSNEGSLFAFVSHELTIRKGGFWIDPLSDEAVVYQSKIEQSIITPGQSRTREIPLTAQLVGTDRVISRVADWGIYDLILKTSHHSGQPDAVDQFESITVVVFPFRQLMLLIIVIALAVVLALGARSRHRLRKASLTGQTSDDSTTEP
jgi:hypothetical protein